MSNQSASMTRAALAVTVTAAVLLSTLSVVHAQPPVPVRMSARTIAMGGATLLSARPIEAGYFNPGSLSLNPAFSLYVPMLQFGGDDQLGEVISFITDNQDDFENFGGMTMVQQGAFLQKMNEEVGGKWVQLDLDPMVGIQLGKLSFSAYSITRANLRLSTQPAANPIGQEPIIQAFAVNDLVLNGALGLQFGPFLHGGVGVRYLSRRGSDGITTISPTDADGFADLGSTLLEQNDRTETAMAVDVGATMVMTKALAVGGLVRGIVSSSSIEDAGWEPEFSGGVRFMPMEVLRGIPRFLIRDITLEANIRDLTNTSGEKYFDKLQLGAEVKLPFWTAARVGLNRGALSYGAGFHFLLVDVQAAIAEVPSFGFDEAGNRISVDRKVYAVSIGIGF